MTALEREAKAMLERSTVQRIGDVEQMVTSFRRHLRAENKWSVGHAAWRLGVSVHEYREIEAGARSPSFETWDRICKL